jgi:hypothetical protein
MDNACDGQGRDMENEFDVSQKTSGTYKLFPINLDCFRTPIAIDLLVKAVGDRVIQAMAPISESILRLERKISGPEKPLNGGGVPEAVRDDRGLPDKEWYTTEEFAQRVELSPWTIRQHCNKGRLRGKKNPGSREWRLSHEELVRYRNEGLRPRQQG